MRFPCFLHILAAVIFLPAFAASADTITTFDLTGTTMASGTVTIDTTTGTLQAVNLTFPTLLSSYAGVGSASSYSYGPPLNFTEIGETWTGVPGINYDAQITLDLPVATLAGYAGGNICSLNNPCANGDSIINRIGLADQDFAGGALTPTPEPSSLALLATGALGVVGLMRRRLLRA